jgi:hypothetical protein
MTTPAPNLSLSVVLDKEVYEPGDTVNATLTLTQLDPLVVTGSGTVDGSTVNGTATASVQSAPADAVTFGISDSDGGTWSQVSVNANVGVFSETLPAAASA